MIQLAFVQGSNIRRVLIEDKKVTFISEIGVPLEIDLDKLDREKDKLTKLNVNKKDLQQLIFLETEDEIAEDITKDFQKSGWRLYKKNAK